RSRCPENALPFVPQFGRPARPHAPAWFHRVAVLLVQSPVNDPAFFPRRGSRHGELRESRRGKNATSLGDVTSTLRREGWKRKGQNRELMEFWLGSPWQA